MSGRPAPDDTVSLRRADYALTDEQRALRESVARFLQRECPAERVRKAEPLGFDDELWRRLRDLGLVSMGLPSEVGGDGAGLIELVLVAEEIGRHLAPVPFIEAVVAARLLAGCAPNGSAWLRGLVGHHDLVSVALTRTQPGQPQLVPAGALAQAVLGMIGGDLVVAGVDEAPPPVVNHGSAPLAWWDLSGAGVRTEVLSTGPAAVAAFGRATREWKLLSAAAQVGIADGALRQAIDYARERMAFGVPIACFQAVSHPLVDSHIAVVAARRLVWKAAWFADHEPTRERQLIPMAFLHAARTAARATTVGLHVLGGLGVTLESDLQLFFRRAKGWANVAGDPAGELAVADAIYGPSPG